MATYYISSAGSNSNNGLGPDASHATNKPYLTLGKALNTGTPVLAGDTVYIGPGILYEGATITPLSATSSTASPLQIIGDPQNAQGFKDGSAVLLPQGLCWVTGRTSGDGVDGPMTLTATLFDIRTNNVAGLQFKKVCLESSPTLNAIFNVTLAGNADLLLEDCRLIGVTLWNLLATGVPTAARNWTMRRCIFIGGTLMVTTVSVAAATADADLNITVEHNWILGRLFSNPLSASGGNLAGGVRFKGNTVVHIGNGGTIILQTTASRASTVVPITLEGNLILGGLPISAGGAGQVTSLGYNRFYGQAANANFTPDGTDVTGAMLNVVLPDLQKLGLGFPRSDVLGWNDSAAATQRHSAWTNTGADFLGRTVRPWGAGAAIGCFESPDVAQDASSAMTGGGTNSLKLTGAGELSFFVPVDAASTTITVLTKSTSYGGTSYPQLLVQANPVIGVTAQTATASDATEQTLSAGAFTPSAKGVVEVRLISRSTSVSSSTFFDLLAS